PCRVIRAPDGGTSSLSGIAPRVARPTAAATRLTTATGVVSRTEPEREKDTDNVMSMTTAPTFEAANHGLARIIRNPAGTKAAIASHRAPARSTRWLVTSTETIITTPS